MQVILHIGANKTGTSAIQGFLSRNTEYLKKQGILYPVSGRHSIYGEVAPSHYPLAKIVERLEVENVRAIIDDIEKEADGYDTVVISSELFHAVSHSAISDALRGHSVTVVAFIRDYVDYLSSWYRQAVKAGTMSCNFEFFAYTANCAYSPWLQRWEEAFGRENLKVFLYDRSAMKNGSAIDHFAFHCLGIADLPKSLEISEENPSISGNLLFLKRVINSFISVEEAYSLNSEMLELALLDESYRGKMSVDDRSLSIIKMRLSEDIKNTRKRYGIDLSMKNKVDGYLSPDHCRLSADKTFIVKESKERGYKFGELITTHLSR